MNNITIELSKEDRKLLEDLMGAVSLLTSVIGSAQSKVEKGAILEKVTEGTTIKKLSDSLGDRTPINVPNETEAYTSTPDPVETTNPAPVAEPTEEVKKPPLSPMLSSTAGARERPWRCSPA